MKRKLLSAFKNLNDRLNDLGSHPAWQPSKRLFIWLTGAALAVVIADSVYASIHAEFQVGLVANILTLILNNTVLLGVVGGLALFGINIIARFRPIPYSVVIRVLSAVGFCAPFVYVLISTLPELGPTYYVNAGFCAALAAAGAFIGSKKRNQVIWLIALFSGSVLPFYLLTSSYYVLEVDKNKFDMYFQFCAVVCLTAPVITILLYDLLRAAVDTGRIPVLRGVPVLLFGLAGAYVGLDLIPEFSGQFVHFALAIGYLMIVLGAAGVFRITKLRYVLPIYLLGLVVQIVLLLSPDNNITHRWTLSVSTVYPNVMLRESILTRLADQLSNDIEPQHTLDAAAAKWNAGAGADKKYKDFSVLLITVDTLRYKSTGFSEFGPKYTPNIDRIAASSYRFHNHYTQGAWTSIAVPALFWGKYVNSIAFAPLFETKKVKLFFEHQIPDNVQVKKVFQAPLYEKSSNMTQVFKAAGFKTAAIINDGSTQYFEPKFGFTKGFDTIIYPSGDKQKAALRKKGIRLNLKKLDTIVADKTIGQLRKHKDDQFFIWCHLFAPHGPIFKLKTPPSPTEYYHRYVQHSDNEVGRILKTLKQLGRYDNTIVAITADHGQGITEHRQRAHGSSLYEEVMHVPLVIHVPGEEGRDIDRQSGLIDVGPTLLDYAGLKVPKTMQGFTMRPILTNPKFKKQRPPVFMETWRREVKTQTFRQHLVGIVDNYYKLIYNKLSGAFTMYDLQSDNREKKNLLRRKLTEEQRRIFNRLRRYLLGYRDPIYIRKK